MTRSRTFRVGPAVAAYPFAGVIAAIGLLIGVVAVFGFLVWSVLAAAGAMLYSISSPVQLTAWRLEQLTRRLAVTAWQAIRVAR